jgi:outer membrane protein OmpA-like peptidoglycan-associated protein
VSPNDTYRVYRALRRVRQKRGYLFIVGHADRDGTPSDRNDAISRARAERIRKLVNDLAVWDVRLLNIDWRGDREPAVNVEGPMGRNRRCELYIYK